jgi:ADP-ribose pyrophosphatase YjhB (NUDIX family)
MLRNEHIYDMEKRILDLFLFSNKLKFNEIEKLVKIRSNKLAYHLKNLVKKNIINKEGEYYSLSDASEYLIPYLSEKKAPLPVVLIMIGNAKKCFLYIRKKRPYAGKLSLPGGRLILGENIDDAVKRIIQEKFKVDAKLTRINSVSLEHVRKNNKIVHSFVLFFVSAEAKSLALVDVNKNKKNIISSDYKLIKSKPEKIKIQAINSYTK